MPTTVTSSGALTLADYAKRSTNLIEKKIIQNVYRTSNVLKDFRMKDDGVRLNVQVERMTNAGLGSISWVSLGEKGDLYSANTEIHGESAFLIRNPIEVDHLMLKQVPPPVNDPLEIRIKGWVESLQFAINDTFFNNTPTANPKAIIGLRHRIANYAGYDVVSGVDINGGGVDLSASVTTAEAFKFLQYVDEALAQMGNTEGDNCVLYMDGSPLRQLQRALRTSATLRQDKDAYDRSVTMYKNMKLVDTGLKQDRSTRVLPIDENSSGVSAASVNTSAFIVDYSDGAFGTWKFGSMAPNRMGIDPSNGVVWRAFFEFGVGLAPATDNCFARIKYIKAA
jgi:hypothetical protein